MAEGLIIYCFLENKLYLKNDGKPLDFYNGCQSTLAATQIMLHLTVGVKKPFCISKGSKTATGEISLSRVADYPELRMIHVHILDTGGMHVQNVYILPAQGAIRYVSTRSCSQLSRTYAKSRVGLINSCRIYSSKNACLS